jgi:hypothetical protein
MPFVKGQKIPGQGKRGPSKATVSAREAIALLVDANSQRLAGWLDQIAADEKLGPMAAWRCMMDVIEYHIPKLARTEHVGDADNPIRVETITRRIVHPEHKLPAPDVIDAVVTRTH